MPSWHHTGWFKNYVEWRKANGDSRTWRVLQAVNGDALGQYVILSGGHQWADLRREGELEDSTPSQITLVRVDA